MLQQLQRMLAHFLLHTKVHAHATVVRQVIPTNLTTVAFACMRVQQGMHALRQSLPKMHHASTSIVTVKTAWDLIHFFCISDAVALLLARLQECMHSLLAPLTA